MARKHKKLSFKLIQGHMVAMVATILLAGSAGTFILPKLFADTSSLQVTSVSVTPSNNANYVLTGSWSGATTGHWQVAVYKGATKIINTATSAKSYAASNVQCGVSYRFDVYAVSSTGQTSAIKSASAATRCPSVAWTSFKASGNNVISSFGSTSGFSQSYTYYLKTGNGNYTSFTPSSTNTTITGKCSTTYSAYLIANAGGQSGPASAVDSATTAACPAPAPGPTPVPSPSKPPTKTPPKYGGGSTSPKSAAPAAPSAPGTPTNFAAEVVAKKVVNLSWDAVSGADHYVLRRSNDNITWQDLTTTQNNDFSDETTAYNMTYYYQLQAVGSDGQVSGNVVAQADTQVFSATGDTVTSPDKRVQVLVPSGAIVASHSCSVSSSTKGLNHMPTGQHLVLGPYDLVCVTDDGQVVDSFAQPVTVTMKLGTVAKGYKNLTVQTITDTTNWKTQKATFNPRNQQLSFTLSNAKTVAVYGVKQKSLLGVILLFLLILLLLGAALAAYLLWIRRRASRTPEQVAQVQQQITAEQEFRQALAQPDCTHLGMAQQVMPSSQNCTECEQQGTQWNGLRICLICGHVGCSDDSPEQHALKHFQQTGHPIIYDYGDPNGNSIGWCYIDQTYI